MKMEDLPSPGGVGAHQYRLATAKQISSVEISGSESRRKELIEFYQAAIAALTPAKKAKTKE
ncbi:hypothetical protein SMA75_20300 [Escherichia coli]|uniref:hypothetical protein n=1 Tax=Escherichia coli TaxID=562 RepID=UPI003078B9A5